MASSFNFAVLLFSLLTITLAIEPEQLFKPGRNGNLPPVRCINIGSNRTVGIYSGEGDFVRFVRIRGSKILNSPRRRIRSTASPAAFNVQREASKLLFFVKLQSRIRYQVWFGFAELNSCIRRSRILTVTAGSKSAKNLDVFSRAGCSRAFFRRVDDVTPFANGLLPVEVSATRGSAALAAICFWTRGSTGDGSDRGIPNPVPSPNNNGPPEDPVLPSDPPESVPDPFQGQSETPRGPVPSVVPTPPTTGGPSTTTSSTPRAPTGGLQLSRCQQRGCLNLRGSGDYRVIGNSLSIREDRSNCRLRRSASSRLSLPRGARVARAILYWSASGNAPRRGATAVLNGRRILADRTYRGGSRRTRFYGAEADVTSLVSGDGQYTVRGIRAQTRGLVCRLNAAYAAWSLVVVYERDDLPAAQINVCTDNFRFTFPAGTYSSTMRCFGGRGPTLRRSRRARTSVVTFESDGYKGEFFFINGRLRAKNAFRGSRAPNLDIKNFDVTNDVRRGARRLRHIFKTFRVKTRFGPAIEGLFFPVRVSYNTV